MEMISVDAEPVELRLREDLQFKCGELTVG